jgi:hypothetical protein
MRLTICLIAALALVPAAAPVAAKTMHKPAALVLNHTSWTYSMKGKAYRESIDDEGNYITETIGGKHADHGTAAVKDGKACFTSAMNNDGEVCWKSHNVGVGHSMVVVNDKGRKLTVHRVAYRPMKMPK